MADSDQPATPDEGVGSGRPSLPGQALCFVLRQHPWGQWSLRPPTVGIVVEWLYWVRTCQRCGTTQRRWFKVTVPAHARKRITKPVPIHLYLTIIGQRVPRPEECQSAMPRELTPR